MQAIFTAIIGKEDKSYELLAEKTKLLATYGADNSKQLRKIDIDLQGLAGRANLTDGEKIANQNSLNNLKTKYGGENSTIKSLLNVRGEEAKNKVDQSIFNSTNDTIYNSNLFENDLEKNYWKELNARGDSQDDIIAKKIFFTNLCQRKF
jgi:hypothetical protein